MKSWEKHGVSEYKQDIYVKKNLDRLKKKR